MFNEVVKLLFLKFVWTFSQLIEIAKFLYFSSELTPIKIYFILFYLIQDILYFKVYLMSSLGDLSFVVSAYFQSTLALVG